MDITDPLYQAGITNYTKGIQNAVFKGDLELDLGARAIRTLWSQTNDRFAKYFTGIDGEQLLDPLVATAITQKFQAGWTDAQQALNYAAGVEGHHQISVSSLEAASRHLPPSKRLQFLKTFADKYGHGGTDPEGMVPLHGIAHQNKNRGKNREVFNAHIDSEPSKLVSNRPWEPNQGTWQTEDFSDITDPDKLADEFWRRSGEPQVRLAELAFDQPGEVKFREALANKLGIRERDLYTYGQDGPKKAKAQLVAQGLKSEEINQIAQEAYGMTYTPKEPRDPNAPKVPFEKPVRDPKTHPTMQPLVEEPVPEPPNRTRLRGRVRKTPEELAAQRARMAAAWDSRIDNALSAEAPTPKAAPTPAAGAPKTATSNFDLGDLYTQDQIDAFSLRGVRVDGSLVSRKIDPIDLTNYGQGRLGKGKRPSKKPPTEVELKYFNLVKEAAESGKPAPYLKYGDELWYYNRGGTKGADGIKDLSLRSLANKLGLEKKYADTRSAQQPTLDDFVKAFGKDKGTAMFNEEKAKLNAQARIRGERTAATGITFDNDHILPNMNGGRTHSRNFRLMIGSRNRLEQNRRPLSPDQRTALMLDGDNLEFISTQGPKPTPLQRQQILEGTPNVKRVVPPNVLQRLTKYIDPKLLGLAAATPGAVGAVFDSAALANAINAPQTKSRRQQLVTGLTGVSGATGLAALAPTPAAPALGAISMGTGLLSTAVEAKAEQKAVKAALKIEQAKKKLDPLQPVKAAVGKAAKNEWDYWTGRLFGKKK